MRECYDTLLSAAAATTNSAYEFSESLRDMGACLFEKTTLNHDEESGKVLFMLGKLQFELQKLIDGYRSHIVQTITIPSESLLNELQIVQEMKQQCEEKRNIYEHLLTKHSRSSFSSRQLKAAHDEYDDEATLFVFRLKSLKQGQSRSLLTQAARHHAAQLCFFRKALKSLETVEPHLRVVAERQHIDYHFPGLDEEEEEEDGEDNNYDDGSYSTLDCGELSFDYGQDTEGQDTEGQDTISTPRKLMEVDQTELTFPRVLAVEAVKENLNEIRMNSYVSAKEPQLSQSAPLLSEKKLDPAERIGQPRRKLHAYVLPTPIDPKNSVAVGSGNNNTKLPPLAEELSFSRLNQRSSALSKKSKRHAFSGPLARSAKFASSANSPIELKGQPRLSSGPLLQNPKLHPSSSPKVSPSNSPKINELHELPRPPSSVSTSTSCSGSLGYSAPLLSSDHSAPLLSSFNRLSPTNKFVVSKAASPLPTPPQTLVRSFSIPSSSQRMVALQVPQPLESPQNLRMAEDIASPPLTPISLPNLHLPSTAVTVAFQRRGIQPKDG